MVDFSQIFAIFALHMVSQLLATNANRWFSGRARKFGQVLILVISAVYAVTAAGVKWWEWRPAIQVAAAVMAMPPAIVPSPVRVVERKQQLDRDRQ